MEIRTLNDLETDSKKVLLRIDINSPIDPVSGRILDNHRFTHYRGTLNELRNSAVTLLAHQSRPGRDDFSTLERHAEILENVLGRSVRYIDDYFGPKARQEISELGKGQILLLENVRFYSEENLLNLSKEKMKKSHPVQKLSPLFDGYINEAFSCSHRNQISMVGFPSIIPSAAGRLLEREVKALNRASNGPETLFLLGGAKVEDSLQVAKKVLKAGSKVAASGLFGNLLLMASGVELGEKSESVLRKNGFTNLLSEAEEVMDNFEKSLLIPKDVAVERDGERIELYTDELPTERLISDIGLETVTRYIEEIEKSEAVVSNGPAGIFEQELFEVGTNELIKAIANTNTFTVVGGGHIVTALRQAGLENSINHVSTGGGALLSYLAGDELPAIEPLKK